MTSKRALRKQEKRRQRRADAAARAPQMLADEEALRQQVRDLHGKVEALRQHAHHDSEIKKRTERFQALSGTFAAELEAFQRLRLEIAAGALWDIPEGKRPADPERQREQAWQTLDRLDALRSEIEALTAETAELLVARADISVVPVDHEALAQGIEKLGAFIEQMESALSANRARLNDLCSKLLPQETP